MIGPMMRLMLLISAAGLLAGCSAPGDTSRSAPAPAGLPEGAVIQYVKLQSGLPESEAMAMLRQREPRFREVPGLVQKIYGREAETGQICGIYIFESQAALAAFRQSELARTIPEAYKVESSRIERYDVLFTLWPGVRSE
jgi:hypothetical protein